jgi:hypothetical protein
MGQEKVKLQQFCEFIRRKPQSITYNLKLHSRLRSQNREQIAARRGQSPQEPVDLKHTKKRKEINKSIDRSRRDVVNHRKNPDTPATARRCSSPTPAGCTTHLPST